MTNLGPVLGIMLADRHSTDPFFSNSLGRQFPFCLKLAKAFGSPLIPSRRWRW